MKNNRLTKQETGLICVGLLLTTSSALVNDWVHLPDFFRGLLVGVGLCMETAGLIIMAIRRRKFNNCGGLGNVENGG